MPQRDSHENIERTRALKFEERVALMKSIAADLNIGSAANIDKAAERRIIKEIRARGYVPMMMRGAIREIFE